MISSWALSGWLILSAVDAGVCSDATCLRTDPKGNLKPNGTFTARCTGAFPDFVAQVPANYPGPGFKLSQDYPKQLAAATPPWAAFDFKKPAEVEKYANAVLEYAYDGMLEADWRPELNQKRRWYHVPWMTTGAHQREFVSGLTDERGVTGPELGLKKNVTVNNYAVGVYNDVAGLTLNRVWAAEPFQADAGVFEEGAAVVKVLVTDALPGEFEGEDILDKAPILQGYVPDRATHKPAFAKLRVLQIDFATKDSRAGTTQWVFGTFAYDRKATSPDPWRRMKLVGLTWGNDPSLTPDAADAGMVIHEGLVNPQTPAYARAHLGWLGRVNGPVDNPLSGCLSCHSTAQFPVVAPILAPKTCSAVQKMEWFRNFSGSEPFGSVQGCVRSPPAPTDVALDFSLQNSRALTNATDKSQANPCKGVTPIRVSIDKLAKVKGFKPDKRARFSIER